MRPKAPRLRLALLAGLACTYALAQDDLALPPDVEAPAEAAGPEPGRAGALTQPPDVEAAERSSERPGAARLADPPERELTREEVVVVGEQRWRLPDLGSEFRREQEARADAEARIRTEFLTPYNPDDPTNRFEPYPLDGDFTRVGFIELFRLKFGRE